VRGVVEGGGGRWRGKVEGGVEKVKEKEKVFNIQNKFRFRTNRRPSRTRWQNHFGKYPRQW
jgi:hypothetical protein